MKSSVLYVIAMFLALSSCSKNELNSEIYEEYFEEWDITIPYQDVSKTKTYKMLENLIDHLNEYVLPIQPVTSSYYPTITPTEFNNYLLNNKEATTLINMEDCVFVLVSTYLASLKKGNIWNNKDHNISIRKFCFFEMFLSSDMFMSKMNVTDKVQFMVLALERYKYEVDPYTLYCFTMMISIMQSNDYTPFVNEVKPMITEGFQCIYRLRMNEQNLTPGYDDHATDLITGYAKQFINDNKK